MAKNVKINSVIYAEVPQVSIPLAEGEGTAVFYDTTGATAASGDILTGKSAFIGNGFVAGSMSNNGAVSGSISKVDGTYTIIPAGFHNGKGAVRISSEEQAKLVSGNIKAGVTILGVSGKSSVVDTGDATAAAGTLISGKTAYVNGTKVTGSLTTVTVSQDSLTKVLTVE
uniref:hypothetical protein n=1 Tax=Megasphaera elsdenii TaxID=907 RepID=UPI003FF09EF0